MQIFEKHEQWSNVKQVIDLLKARGYKAWLAGGCVRDALLGVVPKDFDIATNAPPDEIQPLFPNSLNIGKKFGIIIVPFDGFQIEIATFRKDGPYRDGRHPESVEFTSPEEDAKRRDFTVNALFFDTQENKVVDYVNGRKDLIERNLRAVGDPIKRFEEDKLRILRAFRFAAQLDFDLDEETFRATRAFDLSEVSFERIREEFKKLIQTPEGLKGLALMEQSGKMNEVAPEIERGGNQGLSPLALGKLLLYLRDQKFDLGTSLSLFLIPAVNFNEHKLEAILERLKFSNEEKNTVLWVAKNWNLFEVTDEAELRLKLDEKAARTLLQCYSIFRKISPAVETKLGHLLKLKSLKLPEPFLSSSDIMSMGINQGPLLGKLKDDLYRAQLNGLIKSRADAEEWVLKKKKAST